MDLHVEIEKRLPGFTLEVSFRTGDAPLGILGPSGAGKTMTLRAIAGLETPTRGRILLDGRTLFDSANRINLPARSRRVGLVFQQYALFPHLTVRDNIAFGIPSSIPPADSQKARERLTQAEIERLHLTGLEERYPQELSGGQQQRVALARALATNPAALLLDEPLSALDPHLRGEVERELSVQLAHFAGPALFVSHNLEEVYRLCPNLLVLDAGRVAAFGPKEEIFLHPPNFAVARITGCKNFSRARRIAGDQVEAIDWGVSLKVAHTRVDSPSRIALRAHHIECFGAETLAENSPARTNTFPCWIAAKSETPFRVTLYLRIGGPHASPADYHLQAEISRDRLAEIEIRPQPWLVRLDPERLFLLPD
ncbi:MAG TPA: sulfate/molybdate ABC transporter ATP-binding protein [Candidatus Acidoferrales bacterium]|nr:sulfate/molybdate ABC transporter ATP-binding protein [Candidatus Acidoferrales bacterium]